MAVIVTVLLVAPAPTAPKSFAVPSPLSSKKNVPGDGSTPLKWNVGVG